MLSGSIAESAGRMASELGIDQPPVDLDEVLSQLGIALYRWPFPPTIEEVVTPEAIALNHVLEDPRRQRELIAHALGHWYLHRSDALAIVSKLDQIRTLQQEREAWAFAEALLVPADWLAGQLYRPPWEIAEECRVTQAFAARCLERFLQS